nr:MAG TPA: hypothetical protein [Caudoviricetes sp.]
MHKFVECKTNIFLYLILIRNIKLGYCLLSKSMLHLN